MKRIASLLLAACLLAAPQLTGKAQAEGFALSDFGARGTALAGGMVARADDRNSMFSKTPSPAVSCWTALSRSGRSHRMSTPDSRYPLPNWRFGYGPAAKWEPIYFSS